MQFTCGAPTRFRRLLTFVSRSFVVDWANETNPFVSCAASGVFRTYRIRQHEFSARNKTFTIAGAAYAADPDAEYSAPGRQRARGVQRIIHVRARCQTYVAGKPYSSLINRRTARRRIGAPARRSSSPAFRATDSLMLVELDVVGCGRLFTTV